MRDSMGAYRLLRVLGTGGMGTVYEAEQEHPRRVVALKVLHEDVGSEEARRRFEIEAEVLGRLQHPGIAQIHEASVHREDDREVPFFAMELVRDALPITAYARRHELPPRARVVLFRRVLEAVQHGHANAVIHRDLKPDNILVDRDGNPKVIDFGVARVTEADVLAVTRRTEAGQLLGTLAYMSPEQCAGDARRVDSRADVYSLGVVLFELVTEVLPYALEGRTFFEMSRAIQQQPPRRFSELRIGLARDLETILRKALEKEPTRRYASCSEFAEDLRRFLDREPIAARPPRAAYQLAMFARRHRLLVAVTGTAVLALLVGLIGTLLGFLEARRERNAARQAEAEVRAAGVLLATRGEELEHQAYVAGMAAASGALAVRDVATVRRLLDEAPVALRDWEWHYLAAHLDESVRTLAGHPYGVTSVVVHPQGERAWSLGFDSALLAWDGAWSSRVVVAPEEAVQNFRRLALHPQGHTLVAPGSRSVRFHQLVDGEPRLVREHPHLAYGAAYRPDGSRVALAVGGGVLFLDGGTGELIGRVERPFFGAIVVAWSPDGRLLAIPEFHPREPYVLLWDVDAEEEVARLPLSPTQIATAAAFHPRRDELFVSLTDGSVLRWALATREVLNVLDRHDDVVSSLAFSPDGTWLATASIDRAVRVFDAHTGELVRTYVGHADGVSDAIFHPDGRHLVSTSIDRTLRVWRLPAASVAPTIPFGRGVLAACDDGGLFGGHYIRGEIFLWSAERGEQRAPWGRAGSQPLLAFAPGGERVAIWDDAGTLRVGAPFDWPRFAEVPIEGETLHAMRFRPDGRRLATAQDAGLCWRDAATGVVESRWNGGTAALRALAWNATGDLVAVGDAAGTASVVADAGGATLHSFRAAEGAVVAVGFVDRDAKLALVGENADGTFSLSLWTVTGEPVQRDILRVGQRIEGTHIAVSPGGTRFTVLGLLQSQLSLFDARTGFPVLALPGRAAFAVPAGCFLGERGTAIVACDVNGEIQRFEAPGFAEPGG